MREEMLLRLSCIEHGGAKEGINWDATVIAVGHGIGLQLLHSFVNFVTQGYKGTVGSSREFWHLMTIKEVEVIE